MRKQQSQTQIDHSDDDCPSTSQIHRHSESSTDERRRRRTIIVERKNGTYGFTLQSYGIHYKKDHEVEMITYVDFVDYEGPAYKAGMREGDVILNINGTDMDKADHKTLVNFIKNCDYRMRMVVIFEDCVRKVELHMRYIHLQKILQTKMSELEKLCLRERQLLEGKWKTHSLPARKKAIKIADSPDTTTTTQTPYTCCRPTVSTEDVAKTQQRQQHPSPTVMLAYQYINPRYRYVLHPSTTSSGEFLLSFEQPQPSRSKEDQHHFIVKTPCDAPLKQSKDTQTNTGSIGKTKKVAEVCHNYAGHLCNPCIQTSGSNGDNTSLEAYDLAASPCCDPHCIPSARRRSRNRRDSKSGELQAESQQKPRPHSQAPQTRLSSIHPNSAPRRYFQFGTGLMSQCSLHSCTSSDYSGIAPCTTGESSGSYTTSLSTDTLYWDGSGDVNNSRQASVKSTKPDYQMRCPTNPQHEGETIYVQYNAVKPKSWDNLAARGCGGYGFGYGYTESNKGTKSHTRNHSTKSSQASTIQYFRPCRESQCISTACSSQPTSVYGSCNIQRRYIQPTKSTESLLSGPKYCDGGPSDSNSLSCECLNPVSPGLDTAEARFFHSPRLSVISPSDPNIGYYSARRPQRADRPDSTQRPPNTSEATRL